MAKRLRDHAMSQQKRYWHELIGYNYRITNLQAALGCAQMERINEFINKKKNIFLQYSQQLSNLKHKIRLNPNALWADNVFWMLCLEAFDMEESSRNDLMTFLKSKGIDSRPYFYPISDMPMYQSASTPVAHQISQRGINLPSYFDLTGEQISYICEAITEYFK